MNPSNALALILTAVIVFSFADLVIATSSCPASQVYVGPYNKLTILPNGYKLINEPFTVVAVRVSEGKETPLTNQRVSVYFYETATKKTLVDSGRTDNKGEYTYTPTNLGKYMVECAGRAPTFDTKKILTSTDLGAVCGDGTCDTGKLENTQNCPVDCTVCGDGKCEGGEDKDNCPDDCIICGDGDCDPAEYWPAGCSCPQDCLKCGDGICDEAHGETAATCSSDCKGGTAPVTLSATNGGFLENNWLYLLIVVAVIGGLYAVVKRRRNRVYGDEPSKHKEKKKGRGGRKKESKSVLESDNEVEEIISELMEQGMSEKRIRGKLKEFGVDSKEADDLLKKTKKL